MKYEEADDVLGKIFLRSSLDWTWSSLVLLLKCQCVCFRRRDYQIRIRAPFISTLLRTNNSANVMFSLIIFSSQPARLQRKRIVCCIGPDDVWAQSICSLQFTLFSRRINPSSTNVIFRGLFLLKYLKSKVDFGRSIIFFNYLTPTDFDIIL